MTKLISIASFAFAMLIYQLRDYLFIPDIFEFIANAKFLDDGYFYTVLTKHFLSGSGLTFDGATPTNGFQPLYLYLLIVINTILPMVHEVRLSAYLSAALYISFSGLWLSYFFTKPFSSKSISLFFTLLVVSLIPLNVNFQRLVINGVETPLTALLFLINIILLEKITESITAVRIIILAIFSAGLVLCRLDCVLLPALFLIYFLNIRQFKMASAYACATILLSAPNFIFNYFAYGTAVPISGIVKTHMIRSHYSSFWDYISTPHDTLGFAHAIKDVFLTFNFGDSVLGTLPLYAFLIVGLFTLVSTYRNWTSIDKILLVYIFAHAGIMLFVLRLSPIFYRYYFIPEVSAIAYLFLNLIHRQFKDKSRPSQEPLKKRILWIAATSATVIYLGNAFTTTPVAFTSYEARVHRGMSTMCVTADKLVPPDKPLGVFWPGICAQLLERSVIPLDGVISSKYFFENYVKSGNELQFLFDVTQSREAFVITYMFTPQETFFEDVEFKAKKWSFIGYKHLLDFKKNHSVDILACEYDFCLMRLKL